MNSGSDQTFSFPPFRLDLRSGALYRDGEKINLRPKTFETLVYLLQHHGRLISKEELISRLWADAFVTDDVLVQSIAEMRRALGDDARNPKYIQTVPRRGYVFIRDLEPEEVPSGATHAPPARGDEEGALPSAARSKGEWALILVILLPLMLALAYFGYFKGQAADSPAATPGAVAVSVFEVQTDDPLYSWLRRGIPNLIETGLLYSPDLPVLTHTRLLEAGALNSDQANNKTEAEHSVLTAARSLNARYLVQGNCVKLGSEFQLNAALLRLPYGQPVSSFSERAMAPEEIFSAVDRLTLSLLQSLAFQKGLHSIQGSLLADSTTRSLRAYQHYVNALEHFLRGGRPGADRAEMELEEAIRVDPEFAMAYLKLAQVQRWAQSWSYRTRDPRHTLEKAMTFSGRLPEAERLLLMGMHRWLAEDDPSGSLQIWEELETRYPSFSAEARVPNMKMEILLERGKPEQALRYGESLLDDLYLTAEAKSNLSADLARASRQLGQLEDAVRFSRLSLELWPLKQGQTYLLHLVQLGRNYLDYGDRDEALRCFRQVSQMAGQDAVHLTNAGWGFYMAENVSEAAAMAERALKANVNYGNAHHLHGWLKLQQGRFREAARSFELAFEKTPPQFGSTFHGHLLGDLPALYYAAVAYQHAGDTSRAQALYQQLIEMCHRLKSQGPASSGSDFLLSQLLTLEGLAQIRLGNPGLAPKMTALIDPGSESFYEWCILKARLEAVAGNTDESLHWLRRAIENGAREFQHHWDNPDFENLRALPEFRRLVHPS